VATVLEKDVTLPAVVLRAAGRLNVPIADTALNNSYMPAARPANRTNRKL
jgi:hypothetical protein